jgi:hypothetical protein
MFGASGFLMEHQGNTSFANGSNSVGVRESLTQINLESAAFPALDRLWRTKNHSRHSSWRSFW